MHDRIHLCAVGAISLALQNAYTDVNFIAYINHSDLLIDSFSHVLKYRHDICTRNVSRRSWRLC